jgi:hypothetical protein
MPPAPVSTPEPRVDLTAAFLAHLKATGRGHDRHYERAAERFLERWPDPMLWAAKPLEVRLGGCCRTRMLVTFLMLHGHLRPGYDYLLARTFISLFREIESSPLRDDLERFLTATRELGFAASVSRGATGLVAARVLIQTGKPLAGLTAEDLDEFEAALASRNRQTGRPSDHYRRVLFTSRSTLFHLGILDRPPALRPARPPRTFEQRLTRSGIPPAILPSFVAYIEQLRGTHAHSTICAMVTHLGFVGRHLADVDPGITSLADLDRHRHIETYLTTVAHATRAIDGAAISIEERRQRIIRSTATSTTSATGDGPKPRHAASCSPRTSHAGRGRFPATLPVDQDRRLTDALRRSPKPLAAHALLLARATGLRIGELLDLELDCVHEIPGQGAWLKVPLGKLQTERMGSTRRRHRRAGR